MLTAVRLCEQEVRDRYGAVVKLIDSGDKLKLDQNHLETVIPAPGEPPFRRSIQVLQVRDAKGVKRSAGKRVLILNGPYRDTEALLEGIDEKNFSATLTLDAVSVSTRVSFTSEPQFIPLIPKFEDFYCNMLLV